MAYETPVTDADLHAYLDGQLSETRRAVVEAWLEAHPDKLKELNDYRLVDRELHAMLDPIISETVPDTLKLAPRYRTIRRIAAALAFVCIGGLAGWQANNMASDSQAHQVRQHLARPAAFAHYVFSTEKKHPVEVGAEQEQHLINWLSNRLHTAIKAPNLSQHEYELVGGRLLPSTNKMAAQFMYQGRDNRRITLYVRRISNAGADSQFQFTENNGINTFYWIDGELGYALSGELARDELITMATASYRQLQPDM